MNNRAASKLLGWARRLVVLTAALSGSAHAAFYSGIWDPPFGPALPGLGWSGSAEFFVPDSCVPTGTAVVWNLNIFNPSADCDGQARVTRAEVRLVDLTPPFNPALPRTLNFSTSFPSLSVIKLDYEDGDLEQLSTLGSNLVAAGFTDYAMGIGPSTFFQLRFTFDGPRLSFWNCPTFTLAGHSVSGLCSFRGRNDNVNNRPTFTITRIPEPTSLWLAGAALLGVVGIRRRPRQSV
jgi:hypothetical protein